MYNTNIPTRVELPSSKQLVRSTLLAVIAAIVLLVTTVLPAEYGIDPTGAGKLLGLTRMGSIKIELAEGAKSDQPSVETSQLAKVGPSLIARVKSAPPALNKNELTIMLRPGQAAEVKLSMAKDASVSYQWQADGPVNFDAHGDPVKRTKGFYHGYRSEERRVGKECRL